jgi:AraC-like DNA-binding protein
MTESSGRDEYVAGSWRWKGMNPSFYLRLAHVHQYSGGPSELATPRRILDHEWVIQLKGDAWLTLPEREASVRVPEGSVTLIPPGLLHAQGQPDSHHVAIHFDLEANPKLRAYDMIRNENIPRVSRLPNEILPKWVFESQEGKVVVPMVQRVKNWNEWVERSRLLVESWCLGKLDEPGEQLKAQSVLSWCFHQFFFEARRPEEQEALESFLSKVEVTDRKLRVGDMARECGMGQTLFRKAVLDMTGLSPRAWLETRRCERACLLLVDTSLSVGEVAILCGYEDPYHFSRVFRRLEGVSPKTYRGQAMGEGRYLQRR